MRYRAEATSLEGFVQQIACCYLRHGYWFYVTGHIPKSKDPATVDRKLFSAFTVCSESAERKLRYRHIQNNMTACSRNGDHKRIVPEPRFGRSPRWQVRQGIGPANAYHSCVSGLPSVAAAAHLPFSQLRPRAASRHSPRRARTDSEPRWHGDP